MVLGTGRHGLLSSRAFHIEEAILLPSDIIITVPYTNVYRNKLTSMHCNNFLLMFVGHSLGLLLLTWSVNLVLENRFHPCRNPSIHVEMKENHKTLP
jgi:hypothetical protein